MTTKLHHFQDPLMNFHRGWNPHFWPPTRFLTHYLRHDQELNLRLPRHHHCLYNWRCLCGQHYVMNFDVGCKNIYRNVICPEQHFSHNFSLQKIAPKRHLWPHLSSHHHPKASLCLKPTACTWLVIIWKNQFILDLMDLAHDMYRKPYIYLFPSDNEYCSTRLQM